MKGRVGRVLAEALPALALLGVGDLLAGLYLGAHSKTLAAVPGLLTLLPVIMGLRGNIFSIMSAKASTILHVEGLAGLKSSAMRKTIGSLLLSMSVLPLVSVLLAHLYYECMGQGAVDLEGVIFVVYSSAVVMFPITLLFLLAITITGFRFGMDPDHYGIPLIMGFADVLAMVFMTHFASLGRLPLWATLLLPLAMLIVSLALGVRVQVLKAAMLAQVLAILLDLVAGVVLERNLEVISRHLGLLVVLPLVNSELGGIGGILASKYSTGLNLGSLEPKLAPNLSHLRKLGAAVILGALLFSLLSVFAVILGNVPWAACLLLTALGTAISVVAWALTHSITIFCHKHGLDPDLLSPPTITGAMDVLGTLMILFISLSC